MLFRYSSIFYHLFLSSDRSFFPVDYLALFRELYEKFPLVLDNYPNNV